MPAQDPTDLDAAVERLYTSPLDDFVAGRAAAVRLAADAGDRLGAERIKRLPKPSVAAWVVNQVVRDRPEEVAALTTLGDELRAATADRDRGRIRALDHLRRERTEALVRAVREAGEVRGRAVSAAVLDRLTETLTAAVMDPDAAAAVRAGRLSRALQHVGFGIVDEQGEDADLVALRPGGGGSADGGSGGVGSGDGGAVHAGPGDGETGGGETGGGETGGGETGGGETGGGETGGGETGGGETGTGETDADGAADLAEAERAVAESAARVDRLEDRRDGVRDRLHAADTAVEREQEEVRRLDLELERLGAERDAARRSLDEARAAADEARAELAVVDDELDAAEDQAAEARRRRRRARER
ncbi:hypothetical protein ACIG47_16395 [Promicromonospora sp. NPDC052451]|uniref:hypothetical protein n=1 Tax=Promicromonospora sp. NPDC052451 TaxID=3364407 RepID=UPI0037C7235D